MSTLMSASASGPKMVAATPGRSGTPISVTLAFSYMSRITVHDERSFDFDIYMNHVLDHGGHRFFQASFNPDEKGTILSVNHDWWGTWVTYLGYTLLYIG